MLNTRPLNNISKSPAPKSMPEFTERTRICHACHQLQPMSYYLSEQYVCLSCVMNEIKKEAIVPNVESEKRCLACMHVKPLSKYRWPTSLHCAACVTNGSARRPRGFQALSDATQTEILGMIHKGDTNKEICNRFGIHPATFGQWKKKGTLKKMP